MAEIGSAHIAIIIQLNINFNVSFPLTLYGVAAKILETLGGYPWLQFLLQIRAKPIQMEGI